MKIRHRRQLVEVLENVWDNGNATGLDGWVGPGRGTLTVDDHAVSTREKDVTKAADVIAAAGGGMFSDDAIYKAGEQMVAGGHFAILPEAILAIRAVLHALGCERS
ncbi:hypothetical protein J2T10_001959 [Paenarthrobacter nicotinovorans]|uniref:Uncharacterized protein n=1 Tax=Paenarthrobacter nicotinovorans TaxID=29320 RepID=A0ABT9TN53_PAENI|nr:hypothetical protein [Paenarthrobacter nicotinovorans]MDQ0102313.1 hypothetical protein [Paenarthrobacter nicotinovorans]